MKPSKSTVEALRGRVCGTTRLEGRTPRVDRGLSTCFVFRFCGGRLAGVCGVLILLSGFDLFGGTTRFATRLTAARLTGRFLVTRRSERCTLFG